MGIACKGCVECNVLCELTLFHMLEGRFLEGQGVSLSWKVGSVSLVISRWGSLMPQGLLWVF